LEEQRVVDVHKAATFADDYKLTHSSSGVNKTKLLPLKVSSVSLGSDASGNARGHEDRGGRARNKSVPTCFYCKKRGHVMSECWVLDKKEKNKVTKSNAVVSVPSILSEVEKSIMPQASYSPFVSQGFCLP